MIHNQPKKSVAAVIIPGSILLISGSVPARPLVEPAASVLPQSADIHTIKSAGLQFELPKGWKAETEPNGSLFVSFEDGAASVTFAVEDDYRGVTEGMKAGLKEKLTGLKSDGEPKESIHNGMTRISETGTGKMEGVKITWSIDVLKAGKNVTILTFGIEEILEKHLDEYEAFV